MTTTTRLVITYSPKSKSDVFPWRVATMPSTGIGTLLGTYPSVDHAILANPGAEVSVQSLFRYLEKLLKLAQSHGEIGTPVLPEVPS